MFGTQSTCSSVEIYFKIIVVINLFTLVFYTAILVYIDLKIFQ